MAKEKDTIITRSNYTYKEKHKVLSSGTIYERDFMTINGGIGPIGKDVIPYSNSNFKFVRRETNNNVIRHNYGGWIENENGRYWTLKEIPEPSSSITNETKIVLNPNHKCLTDFVYYGSCKELILATLRSIILTYPGQLFPYSRYDGSIKTLRKDIPEFLRAFGALSDIWHDESTGYFITDIFVDRPFFDIIRDHLPVRSDVIHHIYNVCHKC